MGGRNGRPGAFAAQRVRAERAGRTAACVGEDPARGGADGSAADVDERRGARGREAPARERHDEQRIGGRVAKPGRQAGMTRAAREEADEEAGERSDEVGAVQRAVTFNGDIASSGGRGEENEVAGCWPDRPL